MAETGETNLLELERRLRALAAETLQIEPEVLSVDARFVELGVNSLELVELAMSIEDAYSVELTREDYSGFETLLDAVHCVAQKLEAARAARPPRSGPDPDYNYPIKTGGAPSKGRVGAPIVIAEFSDFQ